jgi:zinc transport system substrate-binding protein
VKALFAEPQFPDQSAQVVARETGVRVYSLDPVVTGPSDPAAARGAYLQAMEKNLEVLQEALR